ncbi:zinc ribbon domain-containing protein [Desulfopila sp. IMCC35008]|uniref:zinc ribbon domain-containing protein n=1 Tax=Desulfopila sp. IMCC35008 TaxID=2653858 RepID=UPI0013D35789|nr:C4-type zinc ribbon domain-containing protein [Desulfopila sp. IMCC35008]
MNPHIAQLTVLQAIDLEIDTIDNEIKTEQNGLDERITALAEREQLINELTAKIDAQESEKRGLEAEAADKLDHVKERQSKMMQVQTGREQTALLKEIEDGKKSVKELEEKIVTIMEQVEELIARVEEEKNMLKGEKKLVEEEKEKVRNAIEAINKGKKSKDTERQKQAQLVEERLLQKYDTLRSRRNGLAVANVLQGVCQGCFMSIPPQQYNMLLKGDKMLDCPACQRMLYHEEPAAE